MLKSKSFVTQCGGWISALSLLTAACGGSNDGTTPGGGSNDGGVTDGSTTTDATVSDDAPSTTDDDAGSCGDGIVEGSESCDDGAKNGATGDPCTTSCAWVCVQGSATDGDSACNDGNPCNGTETCQANHTCASGTPLANGASCGTGELCNAGVCAQAVCGDGIVTPPEECDDGSNNGSATDGCTQQCTFVCVSTVPARDCVPNDPCQGQGTCNDTTHTCTAGTPESNGTVCSGSSLDGGIADGGGDAGAIDVCKAGACVPGYCGDGVLEPGEQCDFGAGNGAGTGCEATCVFSCTKSPESCTTVDSCGGTNTCTTVTFSDAGAAAVGQKCVLGTPPAAGTPCGTGGGTCSGGVCTSSLCGNGVLDTGEQCDFGSGKNIAGSGCEPDCQFSCQKTPSDTCQTNVCAANPTVCTTVPAGTTGTSGQKCNATTELAACGDCSSTGVCVSNQCATSRCGDGCVDARTGETCEPPGTATCDASCHTIVPAICGNNKRETGEQCDDGNLFNLDGCDSTCKFEQEQRANSVTIEFGKDSFCAQNALGGAIASAAQSTLSSALSSSVDTGSTSIEFKFLGITDLTGTAQASGLQVGVISGTPAAIPSGETYDGGSDMDWWYTTTGTTIDSSRNPISLTTATFAAKLLAAKNASLGVTISIAGTPATLAISGATINANVGGVSTPTESTNGQTPGHLASENLDPTLQSFASMNNGKLCGNISAASLASVPVPTALLPGAGVTSCTNVTYTSANSLLDVLVTGCTTILGAVKIINKTQPDEPAGATYTLTADATTHIVDACTNAAGTVALPTCLAAASYSSYFQFTSDRIIAK